MTMTSMPTNGETFRNTVPTKDGLEAIDFFAFIIGAIMTLGPLAATALYFR